MGPGIGLILLNLLRFRDLMLKILSDQNKTHNNHSSRLFTYFPGEDDLEVKTAVCAQVRLSA